MQQCTHGISQRGLSGRCGAARSRRAPNSDRSVSLCLHPAAQVAQSRAAPRPGPAAPRPAGTRGRTSRVSRHRRGAEREAANLRHLLPAAGCCTPRQGLPLGLPSSVHAPRRHRKAPPTQFSSPPPPHCNGIATGARRPALTPASKMAAPAPHGGGRFTYRSGGRRQEREGSALPVSAPPSPRWRRREAVTVPARPRSAGSSRALARETGSAPLSLTWKHAHHSPLPAYCADRQPAQPTRARRGQLSPEGPNGATL